MIVGANLRRRENNAAESSFMRLMKRMEISLKMTSFILTALGYLLLCLVRALRTQGISLFGTFRDFEANSSS